MMLDSALRSIAVTATPIALLVVGASFSGSEALKRLKSARGFFLHQAVFPSGCVPAVGSELRVS